jgi:hypothetical protein
VRVKDDWVNTTVTRILEEQIALETAAVMASESSSPLDVITSSVGSDDGSGDNDEVTTPVSANMSNIKARRFYNNLDCQDAFKRYMCWINFPRCDEVFEDASLPMCQSACENFFRVCGYPLEMHYCPVEQHRDDGTNDAFSNFDTTANDNTKTAFFPGMPFHRNEFIPNTDADPRVVCTPSIKGAAVRGKDQRFAVFLTTMAFAVSSCLLFNSIM